MFIEKQVTKVARVLEDNTNRSSTRITNWSSINVDFEAYAEIGFDLFEAPSLEGYFF